MKTNVIVEQLEQQIRQIHQDALNSYLHDTPQYKNSEYFVALCYLHAIIKRLEANGYKITKES